MAGQRRRIVSTVIWSLPILLPLVVVGCGPDLGSDDWCAKMRDKPKIEWTAEEIKAFTHACVGRRDPDMQAPD